MSTKIRRKSNADKWDKRELGASAEHAVPSASEASESVDNALGLQLISIRLQADLIEDLKVLAKKQGLGYQPLIRMVLTQYVTESRKKTR